VQPPDDGKLPEDLYGSAMALGTEWAVVGAPDDTCGISEGATGSNGYRAGSAYLFRLIGGTWTYQTKLRASTPKVNGRYGGAVALSGNTLAVTSTRHTPQDNSAVHVYALSGDTWSLQQEIIIPGLLFSVPVLALEGNTLLVTSPETGAVNAFERSGQTWVWKGNLAESFAVPMGSRFGAAVVLAETRAFIGAPGSGMLAGVVYEFTYAGGAWSRTRTLPSPAGNIFDYFGRTLAFQNGFLVAGARVPAALTNNPIPGGTPGRVYVFSENGSGWTLARTIERPQAVTGLEWGGSLTAGSNRVIIGTSVSSGDNKAFFQSLEIVGNSPAAWALVPLPTPARSLYWSIGSTVASLGNTLWRGGGLSSGQSYTSNLYIDRFSFANSAWTSQGILDSPPPSQLQPWPKQLLGAGDEVLLGTPGWDNGERPVGIVHVFAPENTLWKLKQTLRNPEPSSLESQGFGASMAYSRESDKLAITFRTGIHFYERAPDQTWTKLATYPLTLPPGASGLAMDWDKDILYIKLDEQQILALQFSDGLVEMLPSRTIKQTATYSFAAANDDFASTIIPSNGKEALVLRRHSGTSWSTIWQLPMPAGSTTPVVWGLSPENLVMSRFTGANSAVPYDFEVLTSSRTNGSWQPLKKVPLPPSIRSGYLDMVIMEGRAMLLGVTRNYSGSESSNRFLDTALVVQTSSGEWRFARWLGLPLQDNNYTGMALAGSYAARLAIESTVVANSNHVEVQNLAGMDVFDGPPVDNTRLPTGSTLDWGGPVVLGQETKRILTIQNTGATTFSLQARIEGAHAADFQLNGLSTSPLNPADEIKLTLTLKPTGTGARDARLVLTPNGTDLPGWQLNIDGTGTDQQSSPIAVQGMMYCVLQKGSAWVCKPAFTGSRPLRIQWRKNGRPLSTLYQDHLWLPNVQPGDAGEYEARVTAGSSQTDVRIQVAVYDEIRDGVVIKPTTTIQKLPTRFWGPGTVSWSMPDAPEVYAGRFSPTLILLSPIAALNYTQYGESARFPTATLTLGTESNVIAKYFLEPHLPPRILRVPSGHREVSGGPNGRVEVEQFPGGWQEFSATGLPEGMDVDPSTGQASGTFTKAGRYVVTWRASNEFGSDSMTSVFHVSAAPRRHPLPGVYTGLISEGGLEAPSGHLLLQMAEDGYFTAQFLFKGLVRRMSSRFVPSEDFNGEPAAVVPLGNLTKDVRAARLRFEPIYDPELGYFTLSLVFNTAQGVESGASGEILRVARPSRLEQQLFTGEFGGLLTPPQEAKKSPTLGTGFCSLSIKGDGTSASGVGTLADGTGFTFSSALPFRQSTDVPSLPVYFHHTATQNTLFGWMPVSAQSEVQWSRGAKPGSRVYPEGFQITLANQFIKRRTLEAGRLLLADSASEPLNAHLTADWNAARLIDRSFTLTAVHRALFPSPNTQRISVDFYAPTGFFTGTFSAPGEGTTTRKVHFRGMMLPGLNTGGGHFLLPKLAEPDGSPPTSSRTSPILSGEITISPRVRSN
jgi:hypothetical protein